MDPKLRERQKTWNSQWNYKAAIVRIAERLHDGILIFKFQKWSLYDSGHAHSTEHTNHPCYENYIWCFLSLALFFWGGGKEVVWLCVGVTESWTWLSSWAHTPTFAQLIWMLIFTHTHKSAQNYLFQLYWQRPQKFEYVYFHFCNWNFLMYFVYMFTLCAESLKTVFNVKKICYWTVNYVKYRFIPSNGNSTVASAFR